MLLLSFWNCLPTAVSLESTTLAIREAAFLVPGAVEEGGYILLGIPSEMALPVSLVRRVRELASGIPGLITWHLIAAMKSTVLLCVFGSLD
jgi:hypothetical protein